MTGTDRSAKVPRLGIVLLEAQHYVDDFGLFEPTDEKGIGSLPTGFFESPSTWPVPTAYAVARGANTTSTLRGDREMAEGLRKAIGKLEAVADFITTDCGFFYSAADEARRGTSVPMIVSGLELIELAGRLSPAPIGVLTASKPRVEAMLAEHPDRDRLHVVGVEEGTAWTAIGAEDFASMRGWDVEALREELRVVAATAFRGELADAGTLLLECTVFPQFRDVLREITSIPILDVASFATTAVGPIRINS